VGGNPRQRVLERISADRCLGLLRRMIGTRSYSATPGEAELARLMAGHLGELGLEAKLQEITPGRYNALGILRGCGGGKSLMYNGHLDTNMVGLGWSVDPFAGEIRDGCIYGIGVSNMKASNAAFVEAVHAVSSSGVRLAGDVVVGLVAGELQGGVGTLHLLREGVRADYFLNGEPTDLAVLTLHAGTFEAAVHVIGRTRHLSKQEEGISAIEKAVAVMAELRRFRPGGIPADRPDHAALNRLNIGVIRGGVGRDYQEWRVAMVPDFCTIKLDCRLAPGQSVEGALADLRAMLDRMEAADPELRTEVELIDGERRLFMPPFEVPRDHPFVGLVAGLHREVTGEEPRVGDVAPYKFYGTDAAHLKATGGMTGVVYGCGGKYNTMPDERVEIADILTAARVYALAILEVCG